MSFLVDKLKKIAYLFSTKQEVRNMAQLQINPKTPYLVQRLSASHKLRKGGKVDYRQFKCVHGGVPETYERQSVNDPEAHTKARKELYEYDYMGSAEFEFGALPRGMWQFLRVFADGNGVIKQIKLKDSVTSKEENIWVFAPKTTYNVAKAFFKLMSYCAVKGEYFGGLKEGTRWDRLLFVEKPDDYLKNIIGLFDLDNCFIAFRSRSIAQAFSNLNDLGDIMQVEIEEVEVREGFDGKVPRLYEYMKSLCED